MAEGENGTAPEKGSAEVVVGDGGWLNRGWGIVLLCVVEGFQAAYWRWLDDGLIMVMRDVTARRNK